MKVCLLSWEFPPRIVGGIARHVFGLAKVNFVPFLSEPNPQAVPSASPWQSSYNPIPEFPSWILLPVFLVVAFVVALCRKRLHSSPD